MQATIYHNSRCSKSNGTLALLKEAGVELNIVNYLESPPDAQELGELLAQLGLSARELIRTGESIYKSLNLGDKSLTESALIKAMAENPVLINRPIVVTGRGARLCRPPSVVHEIL